ncbi:MAG: hypothetical protein AAB815_00935 [Patescibacteria group bacterium]
MPRNWNKGLTKETSLSVRKISETMKLKRIDNFRDWRERMKLAGKIKFEYAPLKRNGDLAELIGVVLGDGHICKFPRTESLRIVANSSNHGFIKRYTTIMEKVFDKKPYVSKRKNSNAVDITIYEKNISKRLNIPTGARAKYAVRVPFWIKKDRKLIVRYLRGLYEAEGSLSYHPKTYTHKFAFANINNFMLENVFNLVSLLGFKANKGKKQVQVSRKNEVQKLVRMLHFRVY